MSYDTEDWCRIQRKTDFWFQKWQEFGEFWPDHSKFSKFLLLSFFIDPPSGENAVIKMSTFVFFYSCMGNCPPPLPPPSQRRKCRGVNQNVKIKIKMSTLIGSFCSNVWLKKAQRSYLSWYLWFRKWHEEYAKFSLYLKNLKIGTLMGSWRPK